jgi:hypothetical protein
MSTPAQVLDFVRESNRIENIVREPTDFEIDAHNRLMAVPIVMIDDLVRYLAVYQPGARLRDKVGMDVTVGTHEPLPGGPEIRRLLAHHLRFLSNPWKDHVRFLHLHPFSDGNGRVSRALWAWQMREHPRGFLREFYYQTLRAHDGPRCVATPGPETGSH